MGAGDDFAIWGVYAFVVLVYLLSVVPRRNKR